MASYDRKMFNRGILNKISPGDKNKATNTPPIISDYKSNLTGLEDIIKYISPLPCQTDPTKSCKKIKPVDSDVQTIMKFWNETAQTLAGSSGPNYPDDSLIDQGRFRKQEKREQFTALYQKYTNRSSGSRAESRPGSSLNKENMEEPQRALQPYKSARELNIEEQNKNSKKARKTLGGKASVNTPFVSPFQRSKNDEEQPTISPEEPMEIENECLKNIEPKMVEMIKNEIMTIQSSVEWSDIAGLEHTKSIIREAIVYPIIRPDIFKGLRKPPKGILFFGPPGTGKTLIGKCIASRIASTFFSISASCLTSKFVGEGEKMVRALFAVARLKQPSVIFIDEVDSLLTQRSESEHESSRRMKTEFLVQLDGAATDSDDQILVIGATNRPQELDEAARRRFVKRLYVPLPDLSARKQIIRNLIVKERHNLTDMDITKIAEKAENYSGSDMANLCKEASMGPVRGIPEEQMAKIRPEDVRDVSVVDFYKAFSQIRPSVSVADLGQYVSWNDTYGTRSEDYMTES